MLITKLRSANTAETKQYRKASKALLVLIPLLGLTYLIVILGPNEGIGKYIFDIARAFLLSTQVIYHSQQTHSTINCFISIYICNSMFCSSILKTFVSKVIKEKVNAFYFVRQMINIHMTKINPLYYFLFNKLYNSVHYYYYNNDFLKTKISPKELPIESIMVANLFYVN